MDLLLGSVLLLSILVFFLLVNTWIHKRWRHRHSCRRSSHLAVHFPSRVVNVGLGDGGGDCHDHLQKEGLFISPLVILCTAEYAGS